MPLLTWNESYSVGVKAMDQQHKRLVRMLNLLHAALMAGEAQPVCTLILDGLLVYTSEHFAAEEQLLARCNFDGLAEHSSHHQAMIEHVREFVALHRQGDRSVQIKLLNFLRDWLSNHILVEDRDYSRCLNQHGIQ